MTRFDAAADDALALGRRNLETVELIRKHCGKARVEHSRFGGVGMLEQATGLPIGMKEVRCEHAAKPPNFVAPELLETAIAFYKNNCIDCPHRILVGVPNLATAAAEHDERARADAERHEREQAQAESVRQERHRRREREVMNEPQLSRELNRLVNLLDAVEPPAEPGRELVATVRAAPQLVTEPVARVLLEASAGGVGEPVSEAVRIAAEAGKIAPVEAVRAAVSAVADHVDTEAAKTLVRFRAEVTAAVLEPARHHLVSMAGRYFGISFEFSPEKVAHRHRPWQQAFDLLVDVDLAGALQEIEIMLSSERAYDRGRAAAAVEMLVGPEPDIAPVVARQLVAALGMSPGGLHYAGFEDDAPEAINAALTACLLERPQETSEAIEAGAPALDDEQRRELFHAYDHVIRHHQPDPELTPEAGAVVVGACLKHVGGDWGEETQEAAYDLLELISKWQPELLDDYAEALLALLLEAVAAKHAPGSLVAQPDAFLQALQEHSAKLARNARVRDIRETLGNIASRRPGEVFALIRPFLDADAAQGNEALEMRSECVELLGFVGQRSEFLNDVLPLLHGALVDREVVIRYSAIEGLIEIARVHPAETIPAEFSETIPALLSDPYVWVHKTITRALTFGVPVRPAQRRQVIYLLLQLASYYANQGDSDTLDNALRAILICTRDDEDRAFATAIDRAVLKLAQKLDGYDLQHFLEGAGRDLRELPEFAEALVNALQRPEIVDEPTSADRRIRRLLFTVSPALLAPHTAGLRAAALAHLPENSWSALRYVEVLQRLWQWNEAVELADDIVHPIPTSVDHAVERAHAERVRALARLEAAVASGSDDLAEFVAEAGAALDAHRAAQANAKTELPWPV